MILNNVSILDCLVFLMSLTPQLILQVGFWETTWWVLQALPFLLIKLPAKLLFERYVLPNSRKPDFVCRSSLFQDVVIRCCRYAFRYMPVSIGRAFLSREVSRPFLLWRIWRHGLSGCQPPWEDVCDEEHAVNGIWTQENKEEPDLIIYYLHGGGFAMGSAYFYLEFCIAFVDLLKQSGFRSPALFALEYTLAPDANFPTQIEEALLGYEYILHRGKSANIVLAGDSAGGTLALSLLLRLVERDDLPKPILATLISPWCYLISDINAENGNDYINPQTLHTYGSTYLGHAKSPVENPLASPGHCQDVKKWKSASPQNGWYFHYGGDEVLAAGTKSFIRFLRENKLHDVRYVEEQDEIHAWPVARMFLCNSVDERIKGLSKIVNFIRSRLVIEKN